MKQIKEAVNSMIEKKLDTMRENVQSALNQKAAQKLEEKKIHIAKSYFGQK